MGFGGSGFISGSFASDKGNGPIGDIPMTLPTVETFDGAWIVEKVTGVDLTGFDALRFDFDAGTLYGSAPCRSFKTSFGPDVQNLMFAPLQIGGGLCDEQTMITERKFLQRIGLVNRLEIDADNQLVMYASDEPMLWATRLTE
ncbi:META domain-containing protein [Parasedimentitalea psychrophila]|uniref:META domain-containing protein n=1 Tax=Parasedimentitalea psychrophila TaxID=2997337 RepID=A0A9Y2KWQ3_9RHOB|nr:META domain-containing protein [Parasedimentitalea psychrophila]WIY23948.1 META domain-containing protein [Parasedimentitalea psychrophila]